MASVKRRVHQRFIRQFILDELKTSPVVTIPDLLGRYNRHHAPKLYRTQVLNAIGRLTREGIVYRIGRGTFAHFRRPPKPIHVWFAENPHTRLVVEDLYKGPNTADWLAHHKGLRDAYKRPYAIALRAINYLIDKGAVVKLPPCRYKLRLDAEQQYESEFKPERREQPYAPAYVPRHAEAASALADLLD